MVAGERLDGKFIAGVTQGDVMCVRVGLMVDHIAAAAVLKGLDLELASDLGLEQSCCSE